MRNKKHDSPDEQAAEQVADALPRTDALDAIIEAKSEVALPSDAMHSPSVGGYWGWDWKGARVWKPARR